MSKYLTKFTTEAQYQAALSGLDYPNVSLVEATGGLHYTKFAGLNIYNAPFGALIIEPTSGVGDMFYLSDYNDYNLTDYPLETYRPIAYCVSPNSGRSDGKTVFQSLYPLHNQQIGQVTNAWSGDEGLSIGFSDVELSEQYPSLYWSTSPDDIDSTPTSKQIKDIMQPLITVDWSGSTIPSSTLNGSSPAHEFAWRFSTACTNEGDWMVPSIYDVKLILDSDNASIVNSVMQHISSVTGLLSPSLFADGTILNLANFVNAGYYQNCDLVYFGKLGNTPFATWNTRSTTNAVFPVFYAGPEEA